MQVPAPIEYERATSVEHAIGLLSRLGEEARLIAGGHSLLPMMKLRLANPEYLVDINDLHDELGFIEIKPSEVRIGAMTRHRELLESDALAAVAPIFRDAERVIADPPVRNRGTLGGALCQADPSEDLSSVCTTLDATCVIRGPQGQRLVSMDDFHVGPYETAVRHDEMLIEVRIPVRPRGSSAYAKVDRRAGDWAVAAAGRSALAGRGRHHRRRPGRPGRGRPEHDRHPGGVRGAARPRAVRRRRSRRPAGSRPSSCRPVTDSRGSADYKRHLAGELTRRTLTTAWDRARGVA